MKGRKNTCIMFFQQLSLLVSAPAKDLEPVEGDLGWGEDDKMFLFDKKLAHSSRGVVAT